VLVQASNDLLAGLDGRLSPESSVLALELAWQTVGTADVPDTVVHAWLAELLTNPDWGVSRYAGITAIRAIRHVAGLHRAAGAGRTSPIAEWEAAERAARAISTTGHRAGHHALRAAIQSAMGVGNRATLSEVTAHAVQAHALAAGADAARQVVDLSRQAIRLWRDLAGLDAEVRTAPVDRARQLTAVPA
jgi:hypothetical protein